MEVIKFTVYILCALTSLAVTILLLRSYAQKKVRLLLWSGLCFVGLTINNFILFLDLIVFPDTDMYALRISATVIGLSFILYGFIWDIE